MAIKEYSFSRESTPPNPEKISAKQKIQYPVRILDFLVGAGGLREPRC